MLLWCRRALLPVGLLDGVLVEVTGDRIAAVTAGIAPADLPEGTVRLDGVVLPGFANTHSHAFHRALRGRTHLGRGDFWTWREQMYRAAAGLDPDHYRELATAVFAEMVLSGWTVVGEFHYVHHAPGGHRYADPNAMGEALVAAARAAGIRLTLLDTCYLHGGIGRPLEEAQRRFGDGDVDRWAERATARPAAWDRGAVRLGAAVHSVRAVDPAAIGVVASVVGVQGWVLHAHVSEQPAENAQCREAYARSPVEVLDERGALSDRFTAVHAVHLADTDIGRLGRRRVTCCICPTTERDLADGVAPAARLRAAGAALAVGTDQHVSTDPFEELRALELDERLVSLERGIHEPGALLEAGTSAGYTALGWAGGGRLEPGGLADLCVVSTAGTRLAGMGRDAASTVGSLVHAAAAGDVTDVMVAGEWVVRGGRHVRVDVAAELDRTIRALMDGED